ncbi:MAG TPA: hypothetical protein VJ821_04855 [Anaerolineales bacterium]|nr:hypothetical protein [Anaerolineales bacterium]
MNIYPIFRVCAVLTVIVLSLFSFASPVEAKARAATVGTTLTIEPPIPVSVGNPAFIVLKLISSKGEPVANQPIELFVNGERERRARTDATGTVTVRVIRDDADTYALSATFKGSKLPSLGSSKAAADLVVLPALIEIQVTPPLPDIKFSLDDRIFASDDYGVARIKVDQAGKYKIDILPLEINDENIQMHFGRWEDEIFEPSREIQVPLKKPLKVGFEVSYQVSQKFVDLDHKTVDSSRITSITYKGSNGATFTFEDTGQHWLPAGRIIRLNGGLQESKILYSVMSIVIDGANVVSQAQQRFYVHENDLWEIQVLLYAARFTARDALFGFPIGTGIHMEYPDGDAQSYSFDLDEGYTLEGLARGIYKVTVTGAQGYAPPTPIALSRNQDVELMVFSYLDMGVIAGVGLFLSVGLLAIGRPYIFKQIWDFGGRLIPKRRSLQPLGQTNLFEKLRAVGARIRFRKPLAQPADGSPDMGGSLAERESESVV